MDKCKGCGKPLGSNKDCNECLEYLVKYGSESIDENGAKRAESDAQEWLRKRGKTAPEKLFNSVKLLAEMISDYFTGKYKEVPWSVIAQTAFALVYVIIPFDLIPDFIPVLGWFDDIGIVGIVIRSIRHVLKSYCIYRKLSPEDYEL